MGHEMENMSRQSWKRENIQCRRKSFEDLPLVYGCGENEKPTLTSVVNVLNIAARRSGQ